MRGIRPSGFDTFMMALLLISTAVGATLFATGVWPR